MHDKLVKKRDRVDYEKIISCMALGYAFTAYLFKLQSRISIRRQARCFLQKMRIDFRFVNAVLNSEHIETYSQLLAFTRGDFSEFYL